MSLTELADESDKVLEQLSAKRYRLFLADELGELADESLTELTVIGYQISAIFSR